MNYNSININALSIILGLYLPNEYQIMVGTVLRDYVQMLCTDMFVEHKPIH